MMAALRSSWHVCCPPTPLSEEHIPGERFTNSDLFYFFTSFKLTLVPLQQLVQNPANHQNKPKDASFSTAFFFLMWLMAQGSWMFPQLPPVRARLVATTAASAQGRVKGRLRDDRGNHMARSSQASRRRETIGNCVDGDLQGEEGKSYVHIRLL